MEVLYVMYVEIERNVRGYQVVTLCNGIRKVYCTDSFGVAIQIVVELGKKYDIYLSKIVYRKNGVLSIIQRVIARI